MSDFIDEILENEKRQQYQKLTDIAFKFAAYGNPFTMYKPMKYYYFWKLNEHQAIVYFSMFFKEDFNLYIQVLEVNNTKFNFPARQIEDTPKIIQDIDTILQITVESIKL
jgi:hypothetical protein